MLADTSLVSEWCYRPRIAKRAKNHSLTQVSCPSIILPANTTTVLKMGESTLISKCSFAYWPFHAITLERKLLKIHELISTYTTLIWVLKRMILLQQTDRWHTDTQINRHTREVPNPLHMVNNLIANPIHNDNQYHTNTCTYHSILHSRVKTVLTPWTCFIGSSTSCPILL